MFEDIWSRAIRGWDIYNNESTNNASNVTSKICKKNNIANTNVKLHSDNGFPMKGAVMLPTFQRLGVMPSFSRPSVSNDNPYSESLFKTLKYKAGYPKSFSSIEEAKKWIANFVNLYNNQHRHSGIKFVTPMKRHIGEDKIILKKRNETYKKAQKKIL
jgi:putative transposase